MHRKPTDEGPGIYRAKSGSTGQGHQIWRKVTLLKQKRRLVRFRIRSSAPIQDLDLEGNANLEVAQKYQDLGVIDIRK
jgi:hypothetical protein